MSELTLVGLRVVQEVAAQGSLTAAADALGYTQSAVSRQVAAMEQAVGAPLFERLPRGVRPTAAGKWCCATPRGCWITSMPRRSNSPGCATAWRAGSPSAPTPRRSRHSCRERSLACSARTRRERHAARGRQPTHLRRLRAGRLELAVVALDRDAQPALDDLRVEQLLEGRLLVAVPATHRLAQHGTVDVAELEAEPWIVGDADPLLDVWPRSPATRRVAFAVRDWTARLGLVAAGLGITPIPTVAAGTIPPGIRLVAVDKPGRSCARSSL